MTLDEYINKLVELKSMDKDDGNLPVCIYNSVEDEYREAAVPEMGLINMKWIIKLR